MKSVLNILDLRPLVRSEDVKPTIILVSSALLLALHRIFGSIEFGRRLLDPADGFTAPIFMFVAAFLLLGILPLGIVLFVFREDPRAYGLGAGDWKAGLAAVVLLLPVIAAVFLYPAAHDTEITGVYPLAPGAGRSAGHFLLLQIPRILFFYASWEFFFRGFMLFGLRGHVGDWLAICIQTIPQCLWHIGLPAGETLSSVGGGILFGVLALRTNSILWPFLLHGLLGVALDLMIVFRL